MTKNLKKYVLLIGLTTLAACRPGVDYAELGYSPNDIIDFGKQAKESKLGKGAEAYALINQNFESGGVVEFEKDLVAIEKALLEWKDLPHVATFNTAQHDNLTKTSEQLEKSLTEIKPKMANATRSAAGALELNLLLANLVKNNGTLAQLVTNLKDDIPQGAKKDFEQESKKIIAAFEHMYQLTTTASQIVVQQSAQKLLFTIKKYLNALKDRAQTMTIFAKTSDDTDGRMATVAALSEVDKVNGLLGYLTTKDQVKLNLVSATKQLGNALSGAQGVKGRFVDKVTAEHSSAVIELYQFALRAFQELEALATGLDESPKKNADAKLRSLAEGAFTNKIAINLERVNGDQETELMKLMRLLGSKKVVGLVSDEANDEFLAALSVAIVKNVSETFGLNVDNVYGFNYQKLNETKAVFSMSDQSFKDYLLGLAHKIFADTSKNGQYANIYVIFAERLGSQAPIAELITLFKQGESRVIVVAHRPQDYQVETTLRPSGLDLVSGVEVAKAVLASLDKRHFGSFPEKLAKVMYAFRTTPESFNLVSIENVIKDTLARLEDNKEPSDAEINTALVNALGASKGGYDVSLLGNSNAWVDSVGTVKTNVMAHQRYYFDEARGVRGHYRNEEQRRLAEQRRLDETRRQAIAQENARKERKALTGSLKDVRRQLGTIIKDLDPAPALNAVRTARKNLIKEIDSLLALYGRVIEKYYELPIDKREAFDNAPDNDFKRFFKSVIKVVKSRDYLANLKDLNAIQFTLRTDAYRYLPQEVLGMLDRYSIWHPYAYFNAALGQAFARQFGGTLANDPTLVNDIENAYTGLSRDKFETLPAGAHPLKTRAIGEFASFRALLPAGGAVLPATSDLMKQALPVGYANLTQPPALHAIRFEAGSNAAAYLINESEGIKALKKIWPDLLGLAGEIQRASGRIYQRLYDVKKE